MANSDRSTTRRFLLARAVLLAGGVLSGCSPSPTGDDSADEGVDVDITLSSIGGGGGSVHSMPEGIECPVTCSQTFSSAGQVLLTAQPDPESEFTGWSEDCEGHQSQCTLDTITGKKEVTATFTKLHLLDVFVIGNNGGDGVYRVSPGSPTIACPALCDALFPHGTVIELGHGADPGWTFFGWTGDCVGLGTCLVTMTSPKSVTATFIAPLVVEVVGSGTVRSDPIGIDCGLDCESSYAGGLVELSAIPDADWTFTGWQGDCEEGAGLGDCMVHMSALPPPPKHVTATFERNPAQGATVEVELTGSGSGRVTSSPAGIDCPDDCEETVDDGTILTLTATPDAGSTFGGWGGECLGGGVCIVSEIGVESVTVTASFLQSPP